VVKVVEDPLHRALWGPTPVSATTPQRVHGHVGSAWIEARGRQAEGEPINGQPFVHIARIEHVSAPARPAGPGLV